MKKMRPGPRIWCLIGIVSIYFYAQGVAWGTAIPVLNYSFESPALASDTFNGSIDDWNQTVSTYGGVWNYTGTGTTFFNTPPPDGNQVAYKNGGTIYQQLTTTIAANTTYTLSVYLGLRNDLFTADPQYSIQIGYDGGFLPLANLSPAPPAPGDWELETLSYTSPASGVMIGEDLDISLLTTDFATDSQGDFDDVTLTMDGTPSAPLPAPAWLLGSGLLGLLGWRKLRKS